MRPPVSHQGQRTKLARTLLLRVRPSHCSLLAILVVAVAAAAFIVRAQGAPDLLHSQKQQLEQVQSEREQMQRQIAGFKLTEQETLQEIQSLADAVKASRRRAHELERDLDKTTAQQQQQDADLAHLTDQEQASRTRMAVRLKRLYRMTKMERSATLFQLARTRSFARDASLLARVQAQDQAALRQYETVQRDLSAKSLDLKATVDRLQMLRSDLDGERKQLADRESGLRESLKGLKRNQQLYAKYLADLEGMQANMQQAVVKLEQDRASSRRDLADPVTLRGKLRSPLDGARLLERFGGEERTVKRFQRGIVLGAPEGSPVLASAPGTVVHAGPFRGYEELVVIDHGKGLFTVYGHLERLDVSKGTGVDTGTRLGTVTWQPEDGRPELYFEVRLDGKPEDPQQWLTKRVD